MRLQAITALLIACILLLLAAPALADDIYRWVDKNGTVHFGSLPPQGVDAELISSVPAAPAEAPADPNAPDPAFANPAEKSPGQIAREEREARRAEQQKQKADLEPQCVAMRQQVEELEPHTRVIVRDKDGTVRRLEDDQRLKAVADAKAFIADNCE
jgi:hypothetical protein